MTENIKARWLTDNEQIKIAPKTLVTQILNEDGTRFKKTFEDSVNNINTAIDETNRTIRDHANNTEIHVTTEEKEAWSNIEVPNLDGYATEDYVKSLVKSLNSNLVLSFYCIEDVTVITNGVSETFPANSNVELKFLDTDVFEIVPTSNNSILSLTAFPGALGTFYPWLEGVKLFSNILFDMNNEDMYSKWSQGNQGAYQVQFAQYNDCIFWSDNPYISDVARRTNYTLCATTQLPLCYSTIPENTFKSFYLAFSVNSDPNWSNPLYKNSFAQANWATQAFSYYGARVIGYPGHDSPTFNITLPKDCRGLMFDARNIECAGTFDAINCTNFGAKSGSWREAFGECLSLRRLYIKNLKVNLNISWSPIDYDSISYIISAAANTNAITVSVSPYTYYLLRDADFSLAASKNITIALLAGNYVEDKRFSTVAYTTGDAEFTGDVIAGGNGGSSPVSLKSVNNLVQSKADANAVLLKTEQNLTVEELIQIQTNLGFVSSENPRMYGEAWFAGDVYTGSTSGTNKDEGSKKLATEEVVDAKIANLINSAPETLDTLGELASALNNDKDIINVLNEAITNKVDKEENKGLSSNDYTDDDKENLIKTEALSHKNYITSTFLDVTLVEAYEADIASLFEN